MTFVEVEGVPPVVSSDGLGRERNNMDEYLKQYMAMEAKYVKVVLDNDEYTRPHSAMQTIRRAIRLRELPVDIKMRGMDIYLVRRDL